MAYCCAAKESQSFASGVQPPERFISRKKSSSFPDLMALKHLFDQANTCGFTSSSSLYSSANSIQHSSFGSGLNLTNSNYGSNHSFESMNSSLHNKHPDYFDNSEGCLHSKPLSNRYRSSLSTSITNFRRTSSYFGDMNFCEDEYIDDDADPITRLYLQRYRESELKNLFHKKLIQIRMKERQRSYCMKSANECHMCCSCNRICCSNQDINLQSSPIGESKGYLVDKSIYSSISNINFDDYHSEYRQTHLACRHYRDTGLSHFANTHSMGCSHEEHTASERAHTLHTLLKTLQKLTESCLVNSI